MLDKLNLDGLSEWSPHNTAIVRELLFSYHDIFTLEPNELGCTSAIKHEIRINNYEPFKEHFRCIPPPLLEEVHAHHLEICWMLAISNLASLPGATWSSWCERKMDPFNSVLTLDASMCGQRKIHTL